MRRTRIDLGQKPASQREGETLARKRHRWEARNKHLPPTENPFLEAIRPKHEHFGDPNETNEELRKRLENLEFGNFPGYFNYRKNAVVVTKTNEHNDISDQKSSPCDNQNSTDLPLEIGLSDERLTCFKKEWFFGKDVLDIGCNRGHVTYAIARLFNPNSITGIDIDSKMINMANRDLHLHLEGKRGVIEISDTFRRERALRLKVQDSDLEEYTENIDQFPLSSYISNGPLAQTPTTLQSVSDVETKRSDVDLETIEHKPADGINELVGRFPNNIIFVEHNYVVSRDELVDKQKPFFDTIVCLSVTKWIHLNYCDLGLKRFFKRIYNHLKPDGILVLEAQPFDNYGRRKKLSDRLKANYYSIKFKPDEFDSYLLSSEVGFRKIVHESMGHHECAGFKRPLKVFLK